jgi:hypothetical protein
MSSTLRALAPALAEQERRLLDAAAARPAVLAWICEGTGHFRDALCGGLRADPLRRPVLGLDVPSIVIDGRHPHVSTVPTWVTEIGASAQQVPPPADLAGAALLRATGPKGPGGVAQPVPRTPAELATWAASWSATARTLGVTAWAPRTRRAASALTVRGLAPGALVTLDAPWMARLGATADDTGAARFSVWYEGTATLTSAGGTQTVTLRADVWEGSTRVDRGITVDVP